VVVGAVVGSGVLNIVKEGTAWVARLSACGRLRLAAR
jgi:hypothetical protein